MLFVFYAVRFGLHSQLSMTGFTTEMLGKRLTHLISSYLISVHRKHRKWEGEQESIEEESVVANFKLVPTFGGAEQKRAKYIVAQKNACFFFISACDFFLWGYLKSKVYVRKPRTVDDLKVSIREEIVTVPQEMLVNVKNFGRHLSDIIFRNSVINVSNQNCIYCRLFSCWHNFLCWK